MRKYRYELVDGGESLEKANALLSEGWEPVRETQQVVAMAGGGGTSYIGSKSGGFLLVLARWEPGDSK